MHLICYLFTPYPVDCCTITVFFFLAYCNCCNLLAASGQLIFPRGIIKVSIYPPLPITCGVLQGSILGPLYVNDMASACDYNLFLFADDSAQQGQVTGRKGS